MRIAIAGASGFVGKALVDFLESHSMRPRVLVRKKHDYFEIDQYIGDTVKNEGLDAFLEGADICINLIGTFGGSSNELVEGNILSTKNLCDAVVRNNVKKVLHFSSAAVYGALSIDHDPSEVEEAIPDTEYGFTKYIGEEIVKNSGNIHPNFHYNILRPTNIYGPNATNGVIEQFRKSIAESGGVRITGDGEQERDFIHVFDVCTLVHKLIHLPFQNQIINVGSGSTVCLNDLVQIFETVTMQSVHIEYTPKVDSHVQRLAVDATKMFTICGPVSYKLPEGIKTVINHS